LEINLMKKSLVALAALASMGAFAQSSVTISGDLWAGLVNVKSSAGTSTTSLGNGPAASRMRFRGTEDIGGGTFANFWLEMQPSMSNGGVSGNSPSGTGTGALFNRGAWLGLSGTSWGEFRVGRQGTASVGTIATVDQGALLTGFNGGGILFSGTNATGRWISANPGRGQNGGAGLAVSTGNISAVTAAGGTANNTGSDVTRVINAFTYLTPTMGGVTVQFQYALSGLATGAANGQGNSLGLQGQYAQGPVYVSLAYQTAGADPLNNITGKQTTFGGTYDFGVAKAGLIFQNGSASGAAALWTSEKAWALTLTAPFGAATPYLRMGQHQTNGLGAFGNVNGKDSAIVNIGVNYALSKRTLINVDYARDGRGNSGNTNAGVASATGNIANPQLFYVGVEHHF
jgi:predicted porin